MKHRTLVSFVLALCIPLAVSAQTTSDVQQKIQTILAQIQTLQQQLRTLQGGGQGSGSVSPTPQAPVPSTVRPLCPTISRAMAYGVQGDDVTEFQKFLIGRGLLSGDLATGFFGAATRSAVQQLQVQSDIVSSGDATSTGWGMVGMRTREWVGKHCGGDGGNVPLPPTTGTSSGVGDQIACTMMYLMCPTGTHHMDGPARCQQRCEPDATVSGAPSVSGLDAPTTLLIGQQGTWNVHASVPNQPGAQLQYSVKWGDETIVDQLTAFTGVTAAVTTTSTFTHTYATAGTYRPTFTVANSIGSAQVGATVVVGSPSGSTPAPALISIPTPTPNQTPAPISAPTLTDTCASGMPRSAAGSCVPTASSGSTGASCATPWGNRVFADGQTVSSQPYFSNGMLTLSVVVPLMQCSNGTWLKCDYIGQNCSAYTPINQ